MNETFNRHRLSCLIRNDVVSSYRSVMMTSLSLAGVILFISLFKAGFNNISENFYCAWFVGILFIWGAILASRAFKELHDKNNNQEYLLLPASSLEKMLARFIFTTIILAAYLLVFTSLVSFAVEMINLSIFGRSHPYFHPFAKEIWLCIAHFIVFQSILFLGAAWFRKNHLIKTILTVNVLSIGMGIFSLIVFRIIFASFFNEFHVSDINIPHNHESTWHAICYLFGFIYFIVLPSFCWFVAWLRIRETEVSHGV